MQAMFARCLMHPIWVTQTGIPAEGTYHAAWELPRVFSVLVMLLMLCSEAAAWARAKHRLDQARSPKRITSVHNHTVDNYPATLEVWQDFKLRCEKLYGKCVVWWGRYGLQLLLGWLSGSMTASTRHVFTEKRAQKISDI